MKLQNFIILLSVVWPGAFSLAASAQTRTTGPSAPGLDSAWIAADRTSALGYEIRRSCVKGPGEITECKLDVRNNGRAVASFASSLVLDYGFFKFLGTDAKQLVIHTYSGGAHCCDTYYVYELKPWFHAVFNGSEYSPEEIGGDLRPVDIDHNGIFELRLDIQSFDYALTSHAGSPFPPVIFAYNESLQKYVLANAKYPDFVVDELKDVDRWIKQNHPVEETKKWELAVCTLLYYAYAGREKAGWDIFDRIYPGADKNVVEAKIKKVFASDITYRSIYKN